MNYPRQIAIESVDKKRIATNRTEWRPIGRTFKATMRALPHLLAVRQRLLLGHVGLTSYSPQKRLGPEIRPALDTGTAADVEFVNVDSAPGL